MPRPVAYSGKQKLAQLRERNERKRLKEQRTWITNKYDDFQRFPVVGEDGFPVPSIETETLDPLHIPFPRPIEERSLEISDEQASELHPFDMPKRPPWSYSDTTEALDEREKIVFKTWLQRVRDVQGDDHGLFEKELDVWRQLWRVIEMSDIILVLADIRHPLLHFPPSLYHHIVNELKLPLILVLTKCDLVGEPTVVAWKTYFSTMYPTLPVVEFATQPRPQGAVDAHGDPVTSTSHLRSRAPVAKRDVPNPEVVRRIIEICRSVAPTKPGVSVDWDALFPGLDAFRPSDESDDYTDMSAKVGSAKRRRAKKAAEALPADSITESHERKQKQSQKDDEKPGERLDSGDEPHRTEERESNSDLHLRRHELDDGQPNAGKSSLLNAILGRHAVSVSRTAGRTKHFQTIHVTDKLRLCDCPGVVFPTMAGKEMQEIMGCMPVSRVRDPEMVVAVLGKLVELEKLLPVKEEDLKGLDQEEQGSLPADFENNDEFQWTAWKICQAYAVHLGYFTSKSARPDVYRAANAIVRMVSEARLLVSIKPPGFGASEALMLVGANKAENLSRARSKVLEAKDKGANVVVLPECFNSPYGVKFFPEYAEPIPGESTSALSAMAKDASVWLIGGSIPERDSVNSHLYNTCTIYNPAGALVATHRKVHLFDIDVPGKIRFKESEVLTGGDICTIVETDYGKLGVAICYDIRFPELAMIAARRGALAMIYPGAFNTVTGPLHWELLQRARAVDNQIYVAACSPARVVEPKDGDYLAWGHSSVVSPGGDVVATTDEKESTVYHDLNPAEITHWRSSIPVVTQRRFDVYDDVSKVLVYEEGIEKKMNGK
ncbi:hypothetical protein HDU93_000373 [Gonapodya sp. JEL0774]|nr:hypothetical protein HDU93_000373 [Gonapodya sp. JEL0774]